MPDNKKANELKALADTLALLEDDLKQKRYFKKSEFYKQSEMYQKEKTAKMLAVQNLARQIRTQSPVISSVINRAIITEPPSVFGIGEVADVGNLVIDEERKEAPPVRKPRPPAGKPPFPPRQISRSISTGGIKDLDLERTKQELKPAPPRDTKARVKTPKEEFEEEFVSSAEERKRTGITGRTPNVVAKIKALGSAKGILLQLNDKDKRKKLYPANLIRKMLPTEIEIAIGLLNAIEVEGTHPKVYMEVIETTRERLQVALASKKRGRGRLGTTSSPQDPVGGFVPSGEPRKPRPGAFVPSGAPRLKVLTDDSESESSMSGMGMKLHPKHYPKKLTPDMKRLIMLVSSRKSGNDSDALQKEICALTKKIRSDHMKKLNMTGGAGWFESKKGEHMVCFDKTTGKQIYPKGKPPKPPPKGKPPKPPPKGKPKAKPKKEKELLQHSKNFLSKPKAKPKKKILMAKIDEEYYKEKNLPIPKAKPKAKSTPPHKLMRQYSERKEETTLKESKEDDEPYKYPWEWDTYTVKPSEMSPRQLARNKMASKNIARKKKEAIARKRNEMEEKMARFRLQSARLFNEKNKDLIRKGSPFRIVNPYVDYLPKNEKLGAKARPTRVADEKAYDKWRKVQAKVINSQNIKLKQRGFPFRITNPYEKYLTPAEIQKGK